MLVEGIFEDAIPADLMESNRICWYVYGRRLGFSAVAKEKRGIRPIRTTAAELIRYQACIA